MSIEPKEDMSPGERRELGLAITGLMSLSGDLFMAVMRRDDTEAETALDLMDRTVLHIRNAIGQYVDRVICPACRKTGKNKPKIRQGAGVIEVGFECEHCQHEWGFGP